MAIYDSSSLESLEELPPVSDFEPHRERPLRPRSRDLDLDLEPRRARSWLVSFALSLTGESERNTSRTTHRRMVPLTSTAFALT